MKVFISWSGERSKAVADALRDWIPLVLHYAKPWLSESDIDAGSRWGDAVAKELEASNFGIICVTRDNVDEPWLLFEAGALAKSLQDAKVIPLLLDLDLSDLAGPLTQFQAKKVDKPGVHEVVRSMNKSAPDAVPPEQMDQLFDALWQTLETKFSSIPEGESSKHRRPQAEVLEELVAGVRGLDLRFRETLEMAPDLADHRRRRRFHPMMLEEMIHTIAEGPGDPLIILLIASVLRDDMPWAYELGVDAYRAASQATPAEASRALDRFIHATESIERSPIGDITGIHPRDFHMLMREMRPMLESQRSSERRPSRGVRQPTPRRAGKGDRPQDK
ncbi:MAG TPA: toll/interleukin-1 receptor domain-containing protein [Solirubrobacteraceae bacterium]|nr:toll/interleukin-1 receptor domain-containing protein [Solirubrobacteraceae bacterium]